MLASTLMRHTADSVLTTTQRTMMNTLKEVIVMPNIKMPVLISLLMGAFDSMNSTGYTGDLLGKKVRIGTDRDGNALFSKPFDFGKIRTSISGDNNGLTGDYQIYENPQARGGTLKACDVNGNDVAMTTATEYFKISDPGNARDILRVWETVEIPTGYENTGITNKPDKLCVPEMCQIISFESDTVFKVRRGFTKANNTYGITADSGTELKWFRGAVFTPEGGSPPRSLNFGLTEASYYISKFQDSYAATKDFEGAMKSRDEALNQILVGGVNGQSIKLDPMELDQIDVVNRMLKGMEAAIMNSNGKIYTNEGEDRTNLITTHGIIPHIEGTTPLTDAYDLVTGSVTLENRKRIWRPESASEFTLKKLGGYFIPATKMYWMDDYDEPLWCMGSLTGLSAIQDMVLADGIKTISITEIPNKIGVQIKEISVLGGTMRLFVSPYLENRMRDKLICINPNWFSLITNKDSSGNSRATLSWEKYGDNTADSNYYKLVCNLGLIPWASNKLHSIIDLCNVLG